MSAPRITDEQLRVLLGMLRRYDLAAGAAETFKRHPFVDTVTLQFDTPGPAVWRAILLELAERRAQDRRPLIPEVLDVLPLLGPGGLHPFELCRNRDHSTAHCGVIVWKGGPSSEECGRFEHEHPHVACLRVPE